MKYSVCTRSVMQIRSRGHCEVAKNDVFECWAVCLWQ